LRFGSVHAFGYNYDENEPIWIKSGALHIVGGWPMQILGTIHAVTTAGEPGKFFLSGNAQFQQFPVDQISQNLNTTC